MVNSIDLDIYNELDFLSYGNYNREDNFKIPYVIDVPFIDTVSSNERVFVVNMNIHNDLDFSDYPIYADKIMNFFNFNISNDYVVEYNNNASKVANLNYLNINIIFNINLNGKNIENINGILNSESNFSVLLFSYFDNNNDRNELYNSLSNFELNLNNGGISYDLSANRFLFNVVSSYNDKTKTLGLNSSRSIIYKSNNLNIRLNLSDGNFIDILPNYLYNSKVYLSGVNKNSIVSFSDTYNIHIHLDNVFNVVDSDYITLFDGGSSGFKVFSLTGSFSTNLLYNQSSPFLNTYDDRSSTILTHSDLYINIDMLCRNFTNLWFNDYNNSGSGKRSLVKNSNIIIRAKNTQNELLDNIEITYYAFNNTFFTVLINDELNSSSSTNSTGFRYDKVIDYSDDLFNIDYFRNVLGFNFNGIVR